MKTIKSFVFFLAIISSTAVSCKKYLQEKSVKNIATPESINDLQQILDNTLLSKGLTIDNSITDEFYIDADLWAAIPELYSKGYVWDAQVQDEEDWQTLYNAVYYANTALFNLDQLPNAGTAEERNQIRGAALFIRSHAFYQIAQIYCKQYEEKSATIDLGIPLRLDADFNKVSVRSTIENTYAQILSDLKLAAELLPLTSLKSRPNKLSAWGLLSRVYLQKGDYTNAKLMADNYLNQSPDLIDYKSVSPSPFYPFGPFANNPEITYYFSSETTLGGIEGIAKIDSNLYNLYANNDLRKKLFFTPNPGGSYSFRGKYSGGTALFTGVATDELYLIRAECEARRGKATDALRDINFLLSKRYDATFLPIAEKDANVILDSILLERRKQLLLRGVRWSDLKRLNLEQNRAITLKRKLGTKTFELPPLDHRYALLIPQRVLNLVDLPQNPR